MIASVSFQSEDHGINNIRLMMLHQFALLLNSSHNIEAILQESAKKIREVTCSNGCHIMFSECLMDRLELKTAILDIETPLPAHIVLPKGQVAQETFNTGKIIIIEDTMYDPRIIQQARESLGHRSMASVPVIVKGETVGVIVIFSKNIGHYSENDGQFLMMLGNHLGLAVENARLMHELNQAATVDSLTGAYNHRYLRNELCTLVDNNHNNPFSLIMIDVNSFKMINDHYGHLAGDCVLKEIVTILKGVIRSGDIVTRYGGDEFAVLLPGAGVEETKIIGSRMEQLIANKKIKFGKEDISVTISWGAVTVTPENVKSLNEIIRLADRKLYMMKKNQKS